jgi:[acyl-carrier-protein] S-malonyltransferase
MVSLNPQHTAWVFPGQGSQTIGMGFDLANVYSVAFGVFKQADDILRFSLSRLAWEGPEDQLNDTINTQPALITHSIAALYVFRELYTGFQPAFVAGHSLGEISALVASNVLSFPAALRLTRLRGEAMQQAGLHSPGGMVAIIGLDISSLEKICIEASTKYEIVQIANDNCPGQVVISGAKNAIERAIQLSQRAGARRIRPLPISIASHSPLMSRAQSSFNKAVDSEQMSDPVIPLIGNIFAQPLNTPDDIRQDLQAQLVSRVRWTESILEMIKHGVTTFIELGSGSVLSGLIKRIDEHVTTYSLGQPSDFDKILLSAS